VSAARVLQLVTAGEMPPRQVKRYAAACEQVDDSGGLAFYRKYTEQFLRRYMWTSLQMGRSPSVLGNLVFRGKASHTGLRNFEDAVIFVHDVDTCLKKLDREGCYLIARIALEEYTQGEVAAMQGTSVRTVMRRYAETLDRLTEILLEVDLLQVPRY
jgi:hypothetical protein